MPTLHYRVEAPGVNILKTVSDEVIYGLLSDLGLQDLFEKSVYPLSDFMASSQYDDGQGTPTMNKNRVDIGISYVMDKTQVPWPVDTPYTTTAYGMRTSQKGNHTPIFIDEKAGILIEHHTVACAAEMKFDMTFITFDDACRAFDAIQAKHRGSLVQKPFDLSFSYPVSMGMYQFLVLAYNAKKDYKGKDFLQYIDDMKKAEISFDVRKSEIGNPTSDKALMVRCQQLNCPAQLTMEQKEPEVTRVGDLPDIWTIEFTFVVQFGRPNLVAVHTPISIDNTPLPESLFDAIGKDHHNSPYVSGLYQDLMCHEFMRRSRGNYTAAQQLARIPDYDDWFVVDSQYQYFQYRPLLVAHFTLDGPTTKIDLTDLGSLKLHPIVRDILKEMRNRVFDYGGLFVIGVYADNLRLSPSLLDLDENLNLTIRSDRPDRVYHFVISETTSIFKMPIDWDQLLIKYRYFFPLTIERNLKKLVDKNFLYIDQDNKFLRLLARLDRNDKLKSILTKMVELGDASNQIFGYTQNGSQLAEYLSYSKSYRQHYTLPTGDDEISQLVREYYSTKASIESRSLFVVFIELCLVNGYITLDGVPDQYIDPNKSRFPYYIGQGGYYGFNTPIRVINYTVNV